MSKRKVLAVLIPVVAIVWLAVPAPVSHSQCVVTNTNVGTVGFIYVTKYLASSGTCVVTATNNVSSCFPTYTTTVTNALVAFAPSGATNPLCQWRCTCGGVSGTITIDGSDGLPVELMHFSVEDDPPDAPEEEPDPEDDPSD